MNELERIIWKVAMGAAGIVTVLASVNGMKSWTEEKSAEVRSEQANKTAAYEQEDAKQKDLDSYIQSLHERETARRNKQ